MGAMLFSCNAGLTDRIRQVLRHNHHSLHQVLIEKSLHITMVEVCKAPVPECHVKWTCAHSGGKGCHGYNLTIESGSIVGRDICSEEETPISFKQYSVIEDSDNIGFGTS